MHARGAQYACIHVVLSTHACMHVVLSMHACMWCSPREDLIHSEPLVAAVGAIEDDDPADGLPLAQVNLEPWRGRRCRAVAESRALLAAVLAVRSAVVTVDAVDGRAPPIELGTQASADRRDVLVPELRGAGR